MPLKGRGVRDSCPEGTTLRVWISGLFPRFMFGLQSQDFKKSAHRITLLSLFPLQLYLYFIVNFGNLWKHTRASGKKKLHISKWEYMLWPNNAYLESAIYYKYFPPLSSLKSKQIPTGNFPQLNRFEQKSLRRSSTRNFHPTTSNRKLFCWMKFLHLKL